MRAIVNYPTSDNLKKELEQKISLFHSSLIIEKLKKLEYTNEVKSKILDLILKKLKET